MAAPLAGLAAKAAANPKAAIGLLHKLWNDYGPLALKGFITIWLAVNLIVFAPAFALLYLVWGSVFGIPNSCGGSEGGGISATTNVKYGDLSQTQRNNAATIIATARSMGLSDKAALAGIATAWTESKLLNYANKNISASMNIAHDAVGQDHYSVGIFQQQTGPFGTYWGTVSDLMDPSKAAARYFKEMKKKVPDYQDKSIADIDHIIQVSRYPGRVNGAIKLATELLARIGPTLPPPSAAGSGASAAAISTSAGACPADGGSVVADGVWVNPLDKMDKGVEFGRRGSAWRNTGGIHTGQDLRASIGTPVKAVSSGKVKTSHNLGNSSYGNYVVIDHGNGITSWYAHLSARDVQEGQTVKGGQVIGKVGNTGNSFGAHLHFEIRKTGRSPSWIDPMAFLANQKATSSAASKAA